MNFLHRFDLFHIQVSIQKLRSAILAEQFDRVEFAGRRVVDDYVDRAINPLTFRHFAISPFRHDGIVDQRRFVEIDDPLKIVLGIDGF